MRREKAQWHQVEKVFARTKFCVVAGGQPDFWGFLECGVFLGMFRKNTHKLGRELVFLFEEILLYSEETHISFCPVVFGKKPNTDQNTNVQVCYVGEKRLNALVEKVFAHSTLDCVCLWCGGWTTKSQIIVGCNLNCEYFLGMVVFEKQKEHTSLN